MTSKLRMKHIAEELGVSIATVSMALNDKPGISEKTRQLVWDTAKKLDYKGVSIKKSYSSGNIINFVIYKIHGKVVSDTPFFARVIEGIEKQARDCGCYISITYLNKSDPDFNEVFKLIAKDRGLGIILLATEMNGEDFTPFEDLPVPLVIIDNSMLGINRNKVLINNFEGAYKATNYLIKKGHKKIGHLKSSVWIKNFEERRTGFLYALKEAQMDAGNRYTIELEPTLEGSYKDLKKILQSSPSMPTAYFADNDIIAMGAYKALREAGIKIPEQVSIIGFDDMPFCTMLDPELTTMRVQKGDIGKIAVNTILELANKPGRYCSKVEVATDLIERDSVCQK